MRIGSFAGPSEEYGSQPTTVHPQDNDVTPDLALAEADAAKALADQLFEDLLNTRDRDPAAK